MEQQCKYKLIVSINQIKTRKSINEKFRRMANLQKIKSILKEKGLTIRYLAGELGISEQGLQKLIRENSTKIETLEAIANILEVSISIFFDKDTSTGFSDNYK